MIRVKVFFSSCSQHRKNDYFAKPNSNVCEPRPPSVTVRRKMGQILCREHERKEKQKYEKMKIELRRK